MRALVHHCLHHLGLLRVKDYPVGKVELERARQVVGRVVKDLEKVGAAVRMDVHHGEHGLGVVAGGWVQSEEATMFA